MSSAKKAKVDVSCRFPILPVLMKQVVSKMTGKDFIRMYKTCSSMASLVEYSWKTFDYENMTIAKEETICIHDDVVKVRFFNQPVSILESSIWRFIRCETIILHGDSAIKYLKNMRTREFPTHCLLTTKCDIATVITAMKLFKALKILVPEFTGDVHDILPVLPFQLWKEHEKGWFFIGKSSLGDLSGHFGEFVIEETSIDGKLFKLTTPCGNTMNLAVNGSCIEYRK